MVIKVDKKLVGTWIDAIKKEVPGLTGEQYNKIEDNLHDGMREAYDEGRDVGYEEGHSDGYEECEDSRR